ncbi:MAG: hypothetical protein Q8K55_09690 [Gemmatimonadaceae bacterium]|nr:hypothetical protein [Gemmatimonadaceae bacterium]
MTSRTTIKIALVLAGIALFGVSVRFNAEAYRWAGIALVAVALLLRFWKEPPEQP